MLRREPAFSLVVILTLALGIGATTAVFTVVDGVVLRPLPYRDPDRLVTLLYGHKGTTSPWFSGPNFRDYSTQSGAFQSTAALSPLTANMTGSGDPEWLQGARVSANYFDVLGVAMQHGRAFAANPDDAGQIVLSDGLWRRRFGGRADVIGSTTMIDDHAAVIVGVAPPAVSLPATIEFWQPLIFLARQIAPDSRGSQFLQVVARLNDGVSVSQATAALQTLGDRLAREFPQTERDVTVQAMPLLDRVLGDVRPTLFSAFGAVMLVLLIACANVASLLLARAQARSREVAVRIAIGASRAQLIGQLLVESLELGLLGAVGGIGLAYALIRALVLLGPTSIPRLANVTVDGTVLSFALVAAIVTSVAFGLMPAVWTSGRYGTPSFLNQRGAVGGGTTRARRALVIAELALAAMLLVSSGLLIRSYLQLQRIEPGFDADGVMTFELALPNAKYPDGARRQAFASALLSRLAAEPGVTSAALVFGLPFSKTNLLTGVRPDAQAELQSADMPSAYFRIISPDYFRSMKIPIRAGRAFDEHDTTTAPPVALINGPAARRLFGERDPIGERIRLSAQLSPEATDGPTTIVGIVGDVKAGGLEEDTPAEVYVPYSQHHRLGFSIAVRTTGDPAAIVPSMRRDVAGLDPLLPLANVRSMTGLVDAAVAGRRFTMLVFLIFAVVAVSLSAVGVYSVLAYVVGQRTREIGVRLAIGASVPGVIWLVVREGLMMTVIGLAAGLTGALATGRWIRSLLFDVVPTDALTLVGVGCALIVVALLATLIPARRAALVAPTDALRAE